MHSSQKKQAVLLGATVLTLGLGAGFIYFRPSGGMPVWAVAVLLGLLWSGLGVWLIRGARSGRNGSGRRGTGHFEI